MKRVVVTGAAGFLGSHLVDALTSSGQYVVGIDNFHRGKVEHLEQADANRFELCRVDVRDYDELAPRFRGAEVVYHLAAQSSVMSALDDLDYSLTTNVIGTCNVLRAASDAGLRRVVFASSREVYGESSSFLLVDEDAELRPKNPYGASKVAGEAYCRAWRDSYGLECQVLRFSNLYGSRDRGRVIPLWMERARDGEDLLLYGGAQVMDFLWVNEAIQSLLIAGECPETGPINVGSGRPTSLYEVAKRILDCFPGTGSRLALHPARSVEVSCFTADVSRMRQHLGVFPECDPLSHLNELATGYAVSDALARE